MFKDRLKRVCAVLAVFFAITLHGYLNMNRYIYTFSKNGSRHSRIKSWEEVFVWSVLGTVLLVVYHWTWFKSPFSKKKDNSFVEDEKF